jgi:hypothetical protein
LNKQQFVLNELGAIASDMAELVKRELEDCQAQERAREDAQKEAHRLSLGPLPLRGLPYYPDHLKGELEFFLARLRSVDDYLSAQHTDLASNVKFLSELARKLTS